MNTHWLLTYQTSRDGRASWQTWNAVTDVPPAVWLLSFYDKLVLAGFTNVVLLNAMEITEGLYKMLDEVIEQ